MKKIIFTCLLISFFSCSEKKTEIPPDILNQKEMTDVISDLQLAQSAITANLKSDSSKYSMNDYLDYILKQHKVKKTDFLNSLKFYSAQPELFQSVYDSVITGLNKLQSETEK